MDINDKIYIKSEGWDPIKEFVSPILYTLNENDYKCIGTLVILRPGLAITAKHVIQEYMKDCRITATSGEHNGLYPLLTYQSSEEGKSDASWFIEKCFLSPATDIAYLKLKPGNKNALDIINDQNQTIKIITMDLNLPKVGSKIFGYGYPKSEVEKNNIKIFPHTTGGKVTKIHERERDSAFVNYPSFEWDARTDGGMSGGPVFNESGKLVGIISTGYETENHEKDFSYVALLWPSMNTKIIFDRADYPNLNGQYYPIIELARDKHLSVNGIDNIRIILNNDNTETISF